MHEAVVNLEIISVLHRYIPEYRVETYIICARSTTAELTASPRHHMETHDLRQYAYADTLTSYATPDLSHVTSSNHLGLSTNPHEPYPPCPADALPYRRLDIFPESLQPDNTFNNMAVNFSDMHTNRNSLPPPSPPSIALALGDAERKKDISQLTNTPKEIVWSLGRPKHSNQAITSTFRVANTSTSLAEVLWLLDRNDLELTDICKAIFMLQAILNKMIEKQDGKKAD
ncbi:uncharacterized protein EV420DRAFT_1650013 [Desarmillaria tabescens]|uniref:Uncharacterized protein n=1 Tax=Armillaria tabescens TaxID=1929756 RepID=A0AA39JEY5_ARMTA|nr:uncharacterized protein EV420DRAFT_1650013 [Desarmillaria tabescens]KAK0441520.1 hypothetical protein EV420DRAFT_1650013 [Desarmillaria tabescens]